MANIKKTCVCCRQLKQTRNDKTVNAQKCADCFRAMGECRQCHMYMDCFTPMTEIMAKQQGL